MGVMNSFQESDIDIMAQHLVSIHVTRKQDGIIFMGLSESYKRLLERIEYTDQLRFNNPYAGPHVLRSNYPVFMPYEYSAHIKLKLDSNIIFYLKEEPNKFMLVDKFAVKGGPPITLSLGAWDELTGLTLFKSMGRWGAENHLPYVKEGLMKGCVIPHRACLTAAHRTGSRSKPYQNCACNLSARGEWAR